MIIIIEFFLNRNCAKYLPGSVEFNQDILGLVESDRIEVGRNQHLDGVLVPVFRQFFREQVGLDFAFEEVGDESLHDVRGQFGRGWLVLGHVIFQMDQTHGWELLLLHAEEFQNALVVIFIGVDGDEQNLSITNKK